ncbi:MAG: 5-dehydro-4-deoxy-D-glucuronate isomerase [Anaerolineaceae bacterium]|nr:5-dehydro-4-deoxy-D-glucuronate isomerase [Anaerolineaceae bacterium]
MDVRYLPSPAHFKTMTTPEIKESFQVQSLFMPGEIKLVYSHADRMIIGGVMPTTQELHLQAGKELAADYFAERREVGVFNCGGPGTVQVDDQSFATGNCEVVYIGRGSREIAFSSDDAANPASFLLISLPAHTTYPTTHVTKAQANQVALGSVEKSNKRVIYQYIHEGGVKSCQLVMGFTELDTGCVWNTMPPHTHDRRCEVYLYFNLADDNIVFHFMGEGNETRHLVMRNHEAVISPSWSIHAGAGTENYCFVWAMGGENQSFNDMDAVPLTDLA